MLVHCCSDDQIHSPDMRCDGLSSIPEIAACAMCDMQYMSSCAETPLYHKIVLFLPLNTRCALHNAIRFLADHTGLWFRNHSYSHQSAYSATTGTAEADGAMIDTATSRRVEDFIVIEARFEMLARYILQLNEPVRLRRSDLESTSQRIQPPTTFNEASSSAYRCSSTVVRGQMAFSALSKSGRIGFCDPSGTNGLSQAMPVSMHCFWCRSCHSVHGVLRLRSSSSYFLKASISPRCYPD